tara:strand:- start:199 stop:729 length:531 start_codon:yes stop_codon:yes gene_type:complete
MAYAQEIVESNTPINRCPPGGESTIHNLATLLNRVSAPLDPNFGSETESKYAFIDEAACIGCALCVKACPVDAIIGAPKLMHTVLASECTGCELCIDPCPVDCIELIAKNDSDELNKNIRTNRANNARKRFNRKIERNKQKRDESIKSNRMEMKKDILESVNRIKSIRAKKKIYRS